MFLFPSETYQDPYRSRRFIDARDPGLSGFFDVIVPDFGKFFSRLFHKTPLEKIGKTIGRGLNIANPLSWARPDLRKQMLKDLSTVAKRTPQIVTGAATGFVVSGGNPLGAIGGAAVAATSKGEGFKFKVLQSGILPGFTGAGIASGIQSASAGISAGMKVGAKEGVKAGFEAGKEAFKASLEQAGKQAFFGYPARIAQQFPTLTSGLEKVYQVGQMTGAVPGVPFTPTDVLKQQGMQLLQSTAQRIVEEQMPAYPEAYGPVVYGEVPIGTNQINAMANTYAQAVQQSVQPQLYQEYYGQVRNAYRKQFNEQNADVRLEIQQYKMRGGAWAEEARRAEEELERIWNQQWEPHVIRETEAIAQSYAQQIGTEQATQAANQLVAPAVLEEQRIKAERERATIEFEAKKSKLHVPAYASNASRVAAMMKASQLPTKPEILEAPEFLRQDVGQPMFLATYRGL